ncbi:MAG: hypothetical protein IT244_02955 [Bacteroidia bacterium]|nr:hypothetical protein [Bacteroidia bacterium]
MTRFQSFKPTIAVLFTGILLGGMVLLFSSPNASWFEKNGLAFTSFKDLKTGLKTTTVKSQPIKRTQAPIKLDSGISKAVLQQIDTLRSKLAYLENFPGASESTALDLFFAQLAHCSDTVVHIWYYGDSQIEGDRITGELRTLLQGKFGGSGAGYLPLSDPSTYRYFELKTGKSLLGLNCFTHKKPRGFGFAGKIYKFNTSDSDYSASTSVWVSPSLKYQKLYLLCGKSSGGNAKIFTKDSNGVAFKIPVSTASAAVMLPVRQPHGKITLTLPATSTYAGLMFEGSSGIQIDNCGIRGHSGDGLKNIDANVIVNDAHRWNTKLVVFHLGNNMIPVIRSGAKNMAFYTQFFEGIINRYKKLLPNASFLLVSAGDMGTTSNGNAVPYPNVGEFVEAMRQAALNTGCAFFDAHAMIAKDGGILGWMNKGRAGLDGHLTPKGQMIYAQNIFTELMREYEVYKLTHTKS